MRGKSGDVPPSLPPGPVLRGAVFTGALVWATPSALRLVVWVDVFSTVFTGAGGPLFSSSISLPRIAACQRKPFSCSCGCQGVRFGFPGVCWGTNRGDRRGSGGENRVSSPFHIHAHKVAKLVARASHCPGRKPTRRGRGNVRSIMREGRRRRGVRQDRGRTRDIDIPWRRQTSCRRSLSPFKASLGEEPKVGEGRRTENARRPGWRMRFFLCSDRSRRGFSGGRVNGENFWPPSSTNSLRAGGARIMLSTPPNSRFRGSPGWENSVRLLIL